MRILRTYINIKRWITFRKMVQHKVDGVCLFVLKSHENYLTVLTKTMHGSES